MQTTASPAKDRLAEYVAAQPTASLVKYALMLDNEKATKETRVVHLAIFEEVEARHPEIDEALSEIAGAEDYHGTYAEAIVEALAVSSAR